MLGTGIYATLGLAIPQAGSMWPIALLMATIVALCNGLSSSRLAAVYPESGGSYTYGYELLHPLLGFTAGWMFLVAKSASAAAAALAVAYLIPGGLPPGIVAAVTVIVFAILANQGMRRGNRINAILVGVGIAGLVAFIVWGLQDPPELSFPNDEENAGNPRPVFAAAAILFVAFTGYGRVATMGEEIRDPARTIPIAVISTVITAAILYYLVGLAGSSRFVGAGSAGLGVIATEGGAPKWLVVVISIGAVTALLGVLFNLILGLSRVALAMARRTDLPSRFAVIDPSGKTPRRAVWLVALFIVGLCFVGPIRFAWELSAAAVLVYYAIANLCALRLPNPPALTKPVAFIGLASCLHLAAHVPLRALIVAAGILVVGLVIRGFVRVPEEPEFEEKI